MENTIDYIPTYLEYTEIIHSYIEDQIEKFGLDDIGRKELIRLGLLDACSRYYDILEDATEDRHNDNWKNCFEGTCAFLDAIGVDGDDRKELVQVIKMVGGSIFVIYKRMRQDIESNAIKMWAGPVRCFRGYLEGNRADPAVDFRQALAMFLYCIRDEDIVLKALNSEYVAKVKLQMYS